MNLPIEVIKKFALKKSKCPIGFDAGEEFTFYVIENGFVWYLTNYDPRKNLAEEKDGKPVDKSIPDKNVWCLFTFYKGKRAMIFYSISQLENITVIELNEVCQKMFSKLKTT